MVIVASRRWHLFWGGLFAAGYLLFYNINYPYLIGSVELSLLGIVVTLLVAIVGAEAPDWDLMVSWMQHRDILTHSAFIPVIIAGIVLIDTFMFNHTEPAIVRMVLVPFTLAFASHLFLDLFPNVDPEKELKKEGVTHTAALLLGSFISGLTGVETIKALRGTYLIHLPFKMKVKSEKDVGEWEMRKTLPLHATRWWLFGNGIVTFILSVVLFLSVNYTSIVIF